MRAKVAVVTGGAHGIGRAVVSRLGSMGYQVFSIDTVEGSEGESVPVQADLADPAQVEAACREILGQQAMIDLLVNNAGISGEWKGPLETTLEEWDRVINVNLRAYWLMAKHLIPHMPEGSAIVNISSTRALMSEPNTEPYSASKGGVVALSHSLAISLAEKGIRVNCISPGWIHVDENERLRPEDHAQHPVGRVGKPEDIAEAVSYLATAGFVTGTNLVVDGGMTRKMIYVE